MTTTDEWLHEPHVYREAPQQIRDMGFYRHGCFRCGRLKNDEIHEEPRDEEIRTCEGMALDRNEL